MTRLRVVFIMCALLLIAVPVASAAPRVAVTGDATTQGTLIAKVGGGTARSVTWERCGSKARTCPTGVLRVGTGASYAIQLEDVDAYVRAVVRVKPRRGAIRMIRSAWKGPVKIAEQPSGSATGMQVGEYTCYSGSTLSTIWIDSGSAYRSPSGAGGSYALEPGSTVYSVGAVKINWTSGPYADWQKETPPFWAEYLPVGTISPSSGTPITKPKILMTFQPGPNMNWTSSGWTTCEPK